MSDSLPYRAAAWNGALRGGEWFPDPFFDAASVAMPRNHRSVLQWAEFLWSSHGTYRSAMERVLSYFLTDVDIGSPGGSDRIGDDEKDKYTTFLTETVDIIPTMQNILRDRLCYGNAFVSLLVPFHRILVCPKCQVRHPLKEVYNNSSFHFKWSGFEFNAKCQQCSYQGPWKVSDLPDKSENKIKIKRWNPHEIDIIHDPFTDETGYVWRIPDYYKKELQHGSLFILERASMQVIEAVKKNWMFLFAPDAIFHMKEPTLGGIMNRGWGVPRTLVNFRQMWYVQVLRRYNEAIALDYIIPFRVITPAPRGGGGGGGMGGGLSQDPLLTMNMGDFSGQVKAMLRRRRRDPASWHTMPFPIQYQALGGEASALAPTDLLDQGQKTLLNDAGVPSELWSGSLTVQTAPVALRLHEANWCHLVSDCDRFLGWLVSQLSQMLSWEVVTAKLRRVTYADDVQRQTLALQLALSQQLSNTTALRNLGFDWKQEQRTIAEEARFQAEQQASVQEEMQQAAFGQQIAKGQPAAGGAPPAAAGGQPGAPADPAGAAPAPGPVTGMTQSPSTPITPMDMLAQADELSNELLGLPTGQRRSELDALRQKNEVLWSLVKSKLDTIRSDARSKGQQAMMQQQYGQG